jgi:hypothetical protein
MTTDSAADTAATTVPRPPEAVQAADAPPRWGALLVILAGVFVTTLDFFIVNVAIPSTQRTCMPLPRRSSSSWRASAWPPPAG